MADIQTQLLTGADLLEIAADNPDKRYELIEGQLIEMNPPSMEHNNVEGGATLLLRLYSRQHKLGRVMPGQTGFYIRDDEKTVRMADVVFISYDRLPPGDLPSGYTNIVPELVVEVVSPTDRADKIEAKVQEWLAFGVLLVWVIYPSTQRVHVHPAGGQVTILNADDTIDDGAALPGFSAEVNEFFED